MRDGLSQRTNCWRSTGRAVSVTEDSLTQCISEIRRALGDAGRDLVRTVPRRGYMIVLSDRPPMAPPPVVASRPNTTLHWHPRVAVPVALIAAILMLFGFWTVAKDAGSPSAVLPTPVIVSRGPTVAVLPFENQTGDAGHDALAEGLTQGMISALGRFAELRVLARGVTKGYGGRTPSTIDLGQTLGVAYVVDGTLRRDGEASRADIRLSDARTGVQVWSKTFEAKLATASLLATEDEISGTASAMIGSYWGAIGISEFKRIQSKSSSELTPYECIVQGVIGNLHGHYSPRAGRKGPGVPRAFDAQ